MINIIFINNCFHRKIACKSKWINICLPCASGHAKEALLSLPALVAEVVRMPTTPLQFFLYFTKFE